MTQVTFRAPQSMAARLGELARYHGRNFSEEVRLALAVHDARATLRYLGTEDGAAEVGDDLERVRDEVEADLRDLEAATYKRRPPFPIPMLN
jgi:hypothetical protein